MDAAHFAQVTAGPAAGAGSATVVAVPRHTARVPRARVIDEEQVRTGAERLFHRTGGLDMQDLARDLAVSRATLYRVAGSRDRLLGDVLWTQGRRAMDRVLAQTPGQGVEHLVEVARRFNAGLVGYPPLRRLLREDPLTAFRVLFMAEGRVHIRFVEMWRGLLQAAADRGEITLPVDADDAAFVFVRIGESMIYADLLSGREPDVELAARVQRALLLST